MVQEKTMKPYELIEQYFTWMNEGSEKSINHLLHHATTEKCEVLRHEAIFALGELADKRIAEKLKEIAKKDKSYLVIHEALLAIGTLGNKQDLPFIKQFLEKENYTIRKSAEIAIDRINENKKREEGTIQTIFKLMTKRETKKIGTYLEHSCEIVRHEAGFALGEIGSIEAIQIMNKALQKEESEIVLHETLFALGTTGKKEALTTIKRYLEDERYIIKESAKIAKDRIQHLKRPYNGLTDHQKNTPKLKKEL
jgi:HEAT repeat protein